MSDHAKVYPDVYVVFKDGTSHGTEDGTPLCVDLSEQQAHYRKIGPCVRYTPAAGSDTGNAAKLLLQASDDLASRPETVAIAQLRHLYAMMIRGDVHDTGQAARGLLGPAIARLEKSLDASSLRTRLEPDGGGT